MSEKEQFEPTINPVTATVQEMFGQVLSQRIQSGAVEQAIVKHVDKLIESAAEDVFRSYGDVGKAIKDQFAKAIMPRLESIGDLPTYHEYVTNRLKLATQQFYDNRLAAVLDAEFKELMTEIPEQITLSWLVEQVVKDSREDNDSYEGSITLIVDTEERSWGSWINLYIDKEEGKSTRDCEFNLHLSKNKETGKYDVLGVRIGGYKAGEKLSMGRKYGFEKILFNIYAMKGQIDLDQGTDADDYDTSWCND